MRLLHLQILFVSVVLLFGPLNISAQETGRDKMSVQTTDPLKRFDVNNLDGVKAHIAGLLEENGQLEADYVSLKKDYDDLIQKVNQQRKEIEKISGKKLPRKKEIYQKKIGPEVLDQGLMDTESEFLLQETKQLYLNNALLEKNESQRLRKLKLADLQYQARSLKMELKYKNFLSEKKQGKKDKELISLSLELRKNLKQEQALLVELNDLEGKVTSTPYKTEQLGRENKQLSRVIGDLKVEADFVGKENALLKNKRLYAKKVYDHEMREDKNKKNQLEKVVGALEKEYMNLDEVLEESLRSQENQKQLMEKVIRYDRENQELRDKIGSLKEKIQELDN